MTALPRQGRLLAIDPGTKRIGLAVSDPTQTVAQPLGTLTRRAGRRFPMRQLREYLERQDPPPVGVVIGLPLDEHGEEGPAARDARTVGELVAAKTGLPVAFWDERMSTARVHADRGANSPTAVDPLAATVVLQGFLERRRQ
jgi:putative Holliday junction resolvase